MSPFLESLTRILGPSKSQEACICSLGTKTEVNIWYVNNSIVKNVDTVLKIDK